MEEELRIEKEKVEYAIRVVQSLEPAGIAARDLKECLKIQIARRGIEDANIYRIIEDYLELLAENRFNAIAKELGVDVLKAQEYGDVIELLSPNLLAAFTLGSRLGMSSRTHTLRKSTRNTS